MIPTAEISYDFIKFLYEQHDYPFTEEKEFTNLFGYRSKDLLVDQFNDLIGVAVRDFFGNKQCFVFPATTKPGLHYLKDELGNAEGTFILADGFYKNCWMANPDPNAKHKIIQAGPGVFKGYRDLNSDGKLDMTGQLYTDCVGVNFHTTRTDVNVTNVVDKFSAGCQVIWDDKHYMIAYNFVMRTFEFLKVDLISYALFHEL